MGSNTLQQMAMAQNYQPPKWMVFLLNMIIDTLILSHCQILEAHWNLIKSPTDSQYKCGTAEHPDIRCLYPVYGLRVNDFVQGQGEFNNSNLQTKRFSSLKKNLRKSYENHGKTIGKWRFTLW